MTSRKSAPELPIQSPIPFHVGSNGEVSPRPYTATDRRADALYWRIVDDKSRRLAMSRRSFVQSAMGTASALWVINQVYGCGNGQGARDGGFFDADANMMEDSAFACEALGGDEFIFDVQTHHVNPEGSWRQSNPGFQTSLAVFPQSGCGEVDFVDCFDTQHYIREMFINSDTNIAVLSAVPATPGMNPLETEEARVTREIVQTLADSQRLVIHGMVVPDQGQAQLDGMQRLAEEEGVAAWKAYTQFGGWRLDDPTIGIPFIEKARELDLKLICLHKGLSLFGLDPSFALPDDVGSAAKDFPDVNFLVYHSGYELGNSEGAYDPEATEGIDTLIRTVLENKVSNVYAELGSTWRFLMTNPTQAAHALGKLLKHLGEDRILWGTDSIWYGTPQDQIVAFRAFQIPEAMQEQYGYPPLTELAKRKILGLNAAGVYGIDPDARRCAISGDRVDNARLAVAIDPSLRVPTMRRAGPQTRREFLHFMRAREGRPG